MRKPDSGWRQGSLLTFESACKLGVFDKSDENSCAVVISHDCDIASDNEQTIELLIGKQIAKIDPIAIAGRHIRRLHLKYAAREQNAPMLVELTRNSHQIPKEKFFVTAQCEITHELSKIDKLALKDWLAARYARAAFPDTFNECLRSIKFEEKLPKILRSANEYVAEVRVRFEEETPSLYSLQIFIIYEGKEGLNARKICEDCVIEIQKLFPELPPEATTGIMLEQCLVVSDEHISYAEIRKTVPLRLEYLSLREDPPAPFTPFA